MCIERKCRESEMPVGTDFSQNSWPYLVLKLPCNPHAMLLFYWSWLTPTQYLFFIGHGLHPHDTCSLSVIAYTHAFLVFGNHFVDFIYSWMYLSTISTRFIADEGDILHLKIKWIYLFSPPTSYGWISLRTVTSLCWRRKI